MNNFSVEPFVHCGFEIFTREKKSDIMFDDVMSELCSLSFVLHLIQLIRK